MNIQEQAWTRLKRFILEIEITHAYYPECEIPEQIPESILISKDIRHPQKWELHINGRDLDRAIRELDVLFSAFKKEVEENLRTALNKDILYGYFFDILDTISKLKNDLIYNKDSDSLDFKGLRYHPDFDKYDLFSYFTDPKRSFLPLLNIKLLKLELYLLKIEECNKLRKKSSRSPVGNRRIEWKKQVNQLVQFYLSQIERGLIETDRKNLVQFLINNFTYNGGILSETTIKTYLDPNKEIEDLLA